MSQKKNFKKRILPWKGSIEKIISIVCFENKALGAQNNLRICEKS
jgi:hypothetical protein